MLSPDTIDRLVNLNIEIEGILRILRNRQNPDAERLLNTLITEFCQLAGNINTSPIPELVAETLTNPVVAQPVIQNTNQETPVIQSVPSVVPREIHTDAVAEQTVQIMPDDEPQSIVAGAVVEPIIGDINDLPRLADKVARREAQDLSRAFTLNDRFRFVRAIFGANAQKFDEVIARLSSLTDYAQAMGYIYGELGLDANDPDVKSFVSIVSKHYDVQ